MTELVVPSVDRYEAWKSCMEDFGEAHEDLHGSGYWYLPEGLQFDTDRDTLEALVAILRRLRRETDRESTMPSDFLWIFEGDEMVGFVRVTYRLNEWLLERGGHIGYSIRPSRRREGHARTALALALARCREHGVERALITCDPGNAGSEATIRANGGVYERLSVDGKVKRFWIDLA